MPELIQLCKLVTQHTRLSPQVVHYLQRTGVDTSQEWNALLSKITVTPSVRTLRLQKLQAFFQNPNINRYDLEKEQEAWQTRNETYRRSETPDLLMRAANPEAFFVRNLPIAHAGSAAQKQDLRERLTLMAGDANSMLYVILLQLVLDYPGKFPVPSGRRIDWLLATEGFIIPALNFALRLENAHVPKPVTPLKSLPGKESTSLRPEKMPAPVSAPSQVPGLLFGDLSTFDQADQNVQSVNLNQFLEKPEAAQAAEEKTKKEEKLQLVHAGLKKLLSLPTDRVGKKVLERLNEGCEIYLKKQLEVKEEFNIKQDKVDELADTLQLQIQFRLNIQHQEAARLCTLAEQVQQMRHGQLLRSVQALGGKAETLTIDDLCLLFARGELPKTDEIDLTEEVKTYLIEATYTQKLERVRQAALDWLEAAPEDEKSLGSALVAEMQKERVIDPAAQPECLLLEYKGNIVMNKVQKENMLEFLKTGKLNNQIRHMIMGSGKTSVLMKLLSLLRADGKRLSVLVLTDELLESMSEEVRGGIAHTYEQLLVPFEVNRSSDWSVQKLTEMRDALERCRLGKGSLITSPKSVHSFYLMLLETAFHSRNSSGSEQKIALEKLGLQREIMRLFSTYGSAVLDEADILLNCRTEVNFPAGKELSMPEEEQDLLLDLYDMLLDNPEIQAVLRCDFHPASAGENASLYMEENFLASVKPKLADLFLERVKNPKSSDSSYFPAVGECITTPEQYALLRDYLLQTEDPVRRKQAEELVAKLPNRAVKNVLALLKEELTSLLPMSLQKNCGEHYNYSLLSLLVYAIPCINGKRIEGSRFANAHETSNYTIQTALKYGIQPRIIENKLSALKSRCLEELQTGKSLKECQSYQEFAALVGKEVQRYHLAKLGTQDKTEIVKQINSDRTAQRTFLKANVIPAIRFHQRKLNSNAQMVARFFHEVIGFSGTLWNADTFPNMLQPLPEHDVDAMSLFLLSSHLIEKLPDGSVSQKNNVLVIPKADGKSVLDATQKQMQQGVNVLAVADCGGYLNEADPDKFAAEMTKLAHQINPNLQGTAYHNRSSNLMMHESGSSDSVAFSQSPLSKQHRLMLYFQPFTTGTDIKLAANATLLLPIGRTTLLRDLFQTAWRARELARGHRIQFLVAEEIKKVIQKKLSLSPETELTQEHILKFCLLNQIEQLSEDTVVAAKLKMLTQVQWEIIKIVLDPSVSNQEVSEMFIDEMQELFCPEQPTEAYGMYGAANREAKIEEIMQKELNDCMTLLKNVTSKVPLLQRRIDSAAIEKELQELIAKQLLPETAQEPANETLDQHVQVQQKQKQKTRQQQQTQQLTAVQPKKEEKKWKTFPWPDVAAEQIFSTSYYQKPMQAALYQTTKSLLPEIHMPPARHLVAPLVGIGMQTMPTATFFGGALMGALYMASRYNYRASAVWQTMSGLSSALYDVSLLWLKEKLLPLEAWGEGAPFPYSLKTYLQKAPALNPLTQALDSRLKVTHNYAPQKSYSHTMLAPLPLENESKDVRELMLIQDKKDKSWQVVLIDKEELQFFRDKLAQDKAEKKQVNRPLRLCLYHPITGVMQQGAEKITDQEIQQDKQLLPLIVQAKFLNGESLYTPAEKNVLKEWLSQHNVEALKQVLFQQILPHRMDSALARSRMEQLFSELE